MLSYPLSKSLDVRITGMAPATLESKFLGQFDINKVESKSTETQEVVLYDARGMTYSYKNAFRLLDEMI